MKRRTATEWKVLEGRVRIVRKGLKGNFFSPQSKGENKQITDKITKETCAKTIKRNLMESFLYSLTIRVSVRFE